MENEPKQENQGVSSEDFSSKADAFLDSVEKGTQEESSPSDKPTVETEVTKDAGADQLKKAEPEVAKEDAGKEADPKDLLFRKAYNEAKAKFEKDFGGIKKEDIEQFKQVTSNPDYIRAAMKTQGYTDDAIDKELSRRGFEIAPKGTDDLQLIAKELGFKPESMDEQTKAVVQDVAKIVDILFKDRISKVLPNALKPIEEQTTSIAQANNASKLIGSMRSTIEQEGVLDFKKDVEPALHKFIDENPEATQEDIASHFKDLNHSLTIERLKSGKKQVERTEAKKVNRPLSKESSGDLKLPKRTGNFSQDADALLDAMNVQ